MINNQNVIPLKTNNKKQGEWPTNLLLVIKEIISTPVPTPKEQLFKFEINKETVEHNWKILKKFPNLGIALENQKDSALGYGS